MAERKPRPRISGVHWFRVLADLQPAGLNNGDAAKRLGIPKTTFLAYKRGGEPNHYDDARVVQLWSAEMGLPESDVPRIDSTDWRL